MGWAFGTNNDGREVGYGVEAECDQPGCTEQIDRGLAFVCGGVHDGGDWGCGYYFCGEHRWYGNVRGALCGACLQTFDTIDRIARSIYELMDGDPDRWVDEDDEFHQQYWDLAREHLEQIRSEP